MNKFEMTTGDIMAFYDISMNTVQALRKEGLPYIVSNSTLFKYDYNAVEAFMNLDGEIYDNDRLLVRRDRIELVTGYSKDSLYRLVNYYEMPCYKIRGSKGGIMYRFDEYEVRSWLTDYLDKKASRVSKNKN